MKTIFIYDQCCQEDIKFFVLDGDYSHLDKIYINESSDTEEEEQKQDELNALLFDPDNGQFKLLLIDSFPIDEINKDNIIITVGFYP